MKHTFKAAPIITILGLLLSGCSRAEAPLAVSPTSTPNGILARDAVPITLPVLDALFGDQTFQTDLKSKVQLTDDQIKVLRKISSAAVTKLRQSNTKNQAGSAEAARQNAIDAIRGVIGSDKSDQLMVLARDHWTKGS